MHQTIARMSPKRMILFIHMICILGFSIKKKKKNTQYFCSKEENQRDCVVYINLNKISEA